ncbi:hypothetical protein OK016_16155 [Vibrio chagasii]|nr:hypothetical protein [Vibrio chagasii]
MMSVLSDCVESPNHLQISEMATRVKDKKASSPFGLRLLFSVSILRFELQPLMASFSVHLELRSHRFTRRALPSSCTVPVFTVYNN